MAKKLPNRRVVDDLNVLWGSTMGVTAFAGALVFSYSDFVALYRTASILHFSLCVLLALATFCLFFSYVIATQIEIKLLRDYLGESSFGRLKPKYYVICFGLAVLFGALIASSHKLLAYAGIMVIYNLFDFWGNWEVLKKIESAIDRKLHGRLDNSAAKAITIMRGFYFDNPTLPRIVTIMFVNWIVVCLALVELITHDVRWEDAGYLLIVINIVVGETVIYAWRTRSIYKLE
jgi:hypothetical protein